MKKSRTTITVETYEVSTVRVKRGGAAGGCAVPNDRTSASDPAFSQAVTTDAASGPPEVVEADLEESKTYEAIL